MLSTTTQWLGGVKKVSINKFKESKDIDNTDFYTRIMSKKIFKKNQRRRLAA